MSPTGSRIVLLLLTILAMALVVILIARRPWLAPTPAAPAVPGLSGLPTTVQTIVLELSVTEGLLPMVSLLGRGESVRVPPPLVPGRGEWTLELSSPGRPTPEVFALLDPRRIEHVDRIATPGATVHTASASAMSFTLVLPADPILEPGAVTSLSIYDQTNTQIAGFDLPADPAGNLLDVLPTFTIASATPEFTASDTPAAAATLAPTPAGTVAVTPTRTGTPTVFATLAITATVVPATGTP
jgi:hypothetical protein